MISSLIKENLTVPHSRWQRHLIGTLDNQGTHIVYGDFDNDGKTDITAADSWFKNPGKPASNYEIKLLLIQKA